MSANCGEAMERMDRRFTLPRYLRSEERLIQARQKILHSNGKRLIETTLEGQYGD